MGEVGGGSGDGVDLGYGVDLRGPEMWWFWGVLRSGSITYIYTRARKKQNWG